MRSVGLRQGRPGESPGGTLGQNSYSPNRSEGWGSVHSAPGGNGFYVLGLGVGGQWAGHRRVMGRAVGMARRVPVFLRQRSGCAYAVDRCLSWARESWWWRTQNCTILPPFVQTVQAFIDNSDKGCCSLSGYFLLLRDVVKVGVYVWYLDVWMKKHLVESDVCDLLNFGSEKFD